MISSDPELQVAILDVGHGNCTVVRDKQSVAVIDVPLGVRLADVLVSQNCAQVEHLILSHMDADHIGGAMRVLADPQVTVRKVWGSADSTKDTRTYIDLLYAIQNAYDAGEVSYSANLNVSTGSDLNFGRVSIEVLHPNIIFAGIGPNDSRVERVPITSNGMSAVLRISLSGVRCVLAPGDADETALDAMIKSGADLKAPVLIFPHHGGLPGHAANAREFSERMVSVVRPDLVVFSTGRGRFNNPRVEVLEGVRVGVPSAHIACTQLNRECNSQGVRAAEDATAQVRGWPSRGSGAGVCCLGSIVIEICEDKIVHYPSLGEHSSFIDANVASPKCRRLPLLVV